MANAHVVSSIYTVHTTLALIERVLSKELPVPNIIIMDNAAFHLKQKIRQLLQPGGNVLLSLPSYSPGFNSNKQSFTVIKRGDYSLKDRTSSKIY